MPCDESTTHNYTLELAEKDKSIQAAERALERATSVLQAVWQDRWELPYETLREIAQWVRENASGAEFPDLEKYR